MTPEQMNTIRQSLLNTVFADYNKLIATLKSMPINKESPLLFKSLSYIDDGILWAKEMILTMEILLGETPPEADTEVVEEPAPVITEDQAIDSK